MTSGVYTITCETGRLVYIGQSSKLRSRWAQHLYSLRHGVHANRDLLDASRKHGAEAFEFKVVEHCVGYDNLIRAEAAWIAQYRESGRYTVANSAGPNDNAMRGQKHTLATRRLISSKIAGVPKTPEHRAAIGRAHEGLIRSESARRALSEAKRGQPNPHWAGDLNPSKSENHRTRMRENNPMSDPKVLVLAGKHLQVRVGCAEQQRVWTSLSACAADLGVSVAAVSAAVKRGTRCCGLFLQRLAGEHQ